MISSRPTRGLDQPGNGVLERCASRSSRTSSSPVRTSASRSGGRVRELARQPAPLEGAGAGEPSAGAVQLRAELRGLPHPLTQLRGEGDTAQQQTARRSRRRA